MAIVPDTAPDWAMRVAKHRDALRKNIREGIDDAATIRVFRAVMGEQADLMFSLAYDAACSAEDFDGEVAAAMAVDAIVVSYEEAIRSSYGRMWSK